MSLCPRCGKGMADGYVGAKGGRFGLQWFRGFADRNVFGYHGESIGEQDGAQMGWLPAARCLDCRIILAHY